MSQTSELISSSNLSMVKNTFFLLEVGETKRFSSIFFLEEKYHSTYIASLSLIIQIYIHISIKIKWNCGFSLSAVGSSFHNKEKENQSRQQHVIVGAAMHCAVQKPLEFMEK